MAKLKLIPFYNDLLKKELFKKEDGTAKLATTNHVLVYGSIEVHSSGAAGCIASNKKIGEECGISDGTAANIISELAKAGWIDVNLVNSTRKSITPRLEITVGGSSQSEGGVHPRVKGASLGNEGGVHSTMNIDNNIDYSLDNSIEREHSQARDAKVEEVKWQPIVNFFYSNIAPSVPYAQRYRKGVKEGALHLLSIHSEEDIQQAISILARSPDKKFVPNFLKFLERVDSLLSMVNSKRAAQTATPEPAKVQDQSFINRILYGK